MERILGLSPVTTNKRVTLPKKVMEELNIESRKSSVFFMGDYSEPLLDRG